MTSWGTFLSTVLPEEDIGWYCIGSFSKTGIPITNFSTTIKGAEEHIQKLLDEKRDVYFGVSKFITGENRQAINAGWNKAFFLDLDCGEKYVKEKKGYLTQGEAVAEFRKFCTTLGLPKPNVVNSGNGLHMSWVLKETITKDKWKEVATLLKRQCVRLGLLVDPSKVTDLAMVLRVPDTYNVKKDPPLLATWLNIETPASPIDFGEFKKLLSVDLEEEESVGIDFAKAPRRTMSETDRNLLGNRISNFGEIMKSKGCPQLLYAYTHQASIEEPFWRAALSVATFCEDRATAIHKISEKHPQYTKEATDRKANGLKGPLSCIQFENVNPGGCDGCENKGKITGPIRLSSKIAVATEKDNIVVLPSFEIGRDVTVKIPELPAGYFRGKNGGIYKEGFVDTESGDVVKKDKLIYKHDFYVVKRMDDPVLKEMVWMRLHLPRDGIREFACPAASLMATEKFKDVVGKQGVLGNADEIKELMNYITAFTKELQDREIAEKMRVQFGWCDDDTKFIVGEREISATGISYSPPSTTTMMFSGWMKEKGTLAEWKRVVNTYGRDGQEARAFLFFAGLGTPLIKFTGQKGLVYSMTENESGTGKTTIQKVINSIFGHPEDLMMIKGDTIKSQFHQMGVYNNLPICVDEVTDMTKEAASAITYGISQGRSNNRMKASTNEMRDNQTRWATAAFMSGNSSMHDKIGAFKATPEAEQLRIIEMSIKADTTLSKEAADYIFEDLLYANYGLAINPFMEHVVANLEAIKKDLKDTQNKFDKEAGLTSKQRFYSAGAATAFVGAKLGKELGLHDIDVDRVWIWAVKYFKELKDSVKSAKRDPLATLGMFLNSHVRSTLIINDNVEPITGLTKAAFQEVYDKLLVRFEPDTNLLYIDAGYFQKWCVEKQIAFQSTLAEIGKLGALGKLTKKGLSKGLSLNTPPVDAVMIDNSVLRLVNTDNLVVNAEELGSDI